MPTTGADGLLEKIVSLRPGEVIALLRRQARPAEALLAAAEEAERLVISDIGRGLAASHALVAVADTLGEPAPRARARRALAQAFAYSNRFGEALGALEQAAALADHAAIPLEAARARLAMLHALARQGQYERAIDVGNTARLAFEAAGEQVLAARADINLGVTHRMRGDPRAALQHFDRARQSLDAQPTLLAQLESNRAEALLDLNEFSAAERAFSSALSAFRQAGMARAAAIVEGNLADLSSRQGRLDRALHHFEQARRHFGEEDSPGDMARLQAEQAEAMSAAGMYEEAAEALRGALPLLEKHKLTWEAARALTALGRVQVRLGRLEDASTSLTRAGTAFEALKHDTGAARVRVAQAEIAAKAGDAAGAEQLLRTAISAMNDRPADVAVARLHLAALALRAGRLDQAVAELAMGIATAQDLDLAPLLADLLHLRARFHRARGSLSEAHADLRASVAQVERIRGTLQADRFRSAFQGDRMAIYEDSISNVLDLRRPDAIAEAFELVERAKSRSLLDLIQGGVSLAESVHGTAADDAEAAMLGELAGLRGELNALYEWVQIFLM